MSNNEHNFDMSAPLTFAAQLLDWLESLGGLSDRSAAAYSGEVNRMREFMADRGVHGVQEVTETRWLVYLRALVEDRSAVASRRCPKLKTSSALQAARITRLFLRHSYRSGWIHWVPLGPKRCRVDKPPARSAISERLIELLLGPPPSQEADARALSAISLAFWASLNPREIAAATQADLRLQGKSAELDVVDRTAPVMLPSVALRQVHAYHDLRRDHLNQRKRVARGDDDAPLLSHLGSLTPLTPHRVWTLLKAWPPQPSDGEGQMALGTRALRNTFLFLASQEPASEIAAVRRQTGRVDMGGLRHCESERLRVERTLERVQQNLDGLRQ
jgi:site-specific recombinase XerD